MIRRYFAENGIEMLPLWIALTSGSFFAIIYFATESEAAVMAAILTSTIGVVAHLVMVARDHVEEVKLHREYDREHARLLAQRGMKVDA